MVNQQGFNELALFAGAGGGILASHLLGWRTVCAVEWEAYPASVLCARQNDGLLPPFPIWDDVQTFDGKPWKGIVDVVSGGFPCQDISAAGNGVGITGNRSSMWKHMARIIGEVRPQYVFVENSPMLTSRGLGVVLGDLASMGFDAEWGVLSANDVGANHLRERIWILGHSNHHGQTTSKIGKSIDEGGNSSQTREKQAGKLARSSKQYEDVAYPNGERGERLDAIQIDGCSRSLNGQNNASHAEESTEVERVSNVAHASMSGCQTLRPKRREKNGIRQANATCAHSRDWWDAEPNVGRVADGVVARVDRLKAIGNGQVPLCAATAFKLLHQRMHGAS